MLSKARDSWQSRLREERRRPSSAFLCFIKSPGWGCPLPGWVFSSPLALARSTFSHPEICLLGLFRCPHVSNQDPPLHSPSSRGFRVPLRVAPSSLSKANKEASPALCAWPFSFVTPLLWLWPYIPSPRELGGYTSVSFSKLEHSLLGGRESSWNFMKSTTLLTLPTNIR